VEGTRLRLAIALLALGASAAAQGGESIREVVAAVRSGLARHAGDSQMAKALRKIKLAERLDDRTIETLQSEGAGAETVAQLLQLRDRSSTLPPPAQPAIEEPAAPAPAEQQRIWNAAHENSLRYTDSLPDFICSEVVRRYTDPNEKGGWRLADTLVLKLTYFDHREDYQLLTINNKSTRLSYEQMNGAITEGEFGSMLAAIFALKSRTNRSWDHWTMLRSRPTHVYRFAIAAANSDYTITSGSSRRNEEHATVGQRGYIYIDDATRMVVRIAAAAYDLPADFDVRKVDLLLDYDFIDVGGRQYLLPLHSETLLDAPPFQHRNETDFLVYRKFSSDATITFGEPVKK
jgi:hypothetical protein